MKQALVSALVGSALVVSLSFADDEAHPTTTGSKPAPADAPTATVLEELETDCSVSFGVSYDYHAIRNGKFDLRLHYQDATGEMVGSGDGVSCSIHVNSVAESFFDDEGQRVVSIHWEDGGTGSTSTTTITSSTTTTTTAALQSIAAAAAPKTGTAIGARAIEFLGIGACNFTALVADLPTEEDFSLDVVAATASDEDILPTPVGAVHKVACQGFTSTSSSTTTTGYTTTSTSENPDDSSTTTVTDTTTTVPPNQTCGDPTGDGLITATDSLYILRNAVGLNGCSPQFCDVNGNGNGVTASDALHVLRVAVGLLESSTFTCLL